jgi:hypothetical protein
MSKFKLMKSYKKKFNFFFLLRCCYSIFIKMMIWGLIHSSCSGHPSKSMASQPMGIKYQQRKRKQVSFHDFSIILHWLIPEKSINSAIKWLLFSMSFLEVFHALFRDLLIVFCTHISPWAYKVGSLSVFKGKVCLISQKEYSYGNTKDRDHNLSHHRFLTFFSLYLRHCTYCHKFYRDYY